MLSILVGVKSMEAVISQTRKFFTLIPARLDRLPWTGFHWRVLLALGITWILDGLEVTFTGAISGILQHPETLGLSGANIGLLGSAYVTGAVMGSLFFGYLTDVMGRKKLFFITLGVYIVGVLCSAFSWNLWSFMFFRFITGAGIGGEYAAINSAIDELIPARVRGRVGLTLNGSYWIGAGIGSLSTIWLLNPAHFAVNVGWRLGVAVGGILGISVLFLRGIVPESPRWLVLRGRKEEADAILTSLEKYVSAEEHKRLGPVDPKKSIVIHPRGPTSIKTILQTMFTQYRSRSILGISLMTAQAFLYNAIFFTYALVLTKFFNTPPQETGLYILPFAFGNFLGPVILGRFFDTIGRKQMITFTYAFSGVLLAITGYIFAQGHLTALSLTVCWSVIFFFASAAASSAYLTVSEIFPLETRALAIAIFYSIGTGIGGIVAPWIFGMLTDSGSRNAIMYGYLFAAVLMICAGIVEWKIGLSCEGQSLESIAVPIASVGPHGEYDPDGEPANATSLT
jgi:MFS family permease